MYIKEINFFLLIWLHRALVEAKNSTSSSPYSTKYNKLEFSVCPSDVNGLLHCNEYGYIDAVKDCACVTYNKDTDEIQVGYCPYGCGRALDPSYINRPNGFSFFGINKYEWNKVSCGFFHRTGTLCGSCINGSYPPVYTFDVKCVKCTNGNRDIWKYILWGFGPLTVFYFALLLLQVNILSSSIFGFVIYSQILSHPSLIRALVVNKHDQALVTNFIRISEMLYGIWNLDFFRTFNHGLCIESDTLTVLSLDFIIAIYPLFLIALTYAMISKYDTNSLPILVSIVKPILKVAYLSKKKWNITTSIVDSFATFILLSNVKLLSTCLDILIPVNVYRFRSLQNFTVTHSKHVYSDATLKYFGPEHLPYAVAAILVFCVFNLFPVLILFFYPFKFFRKFINKFPSHCILFLNTFVDSFQGCYKDGITEPGRDDRWVSVLPFIIRWVCFTTYGLILNASFFPLVTIFIVIMVIFLINFNPLLKNFHSMYASWIIHTLLLAIFGASASGTDLVQITGQSMLLLNVFYAVYATATVLPIFGILLLIFQLFTKGKCIYKNRRE